MLPIRLPMVPRRRAQPPQAIRLRAIRLPAIRLPAIRPPAIRAKRAPPHSAGNPTSVHREKSVNPFPLVSGGAGKPGLEFSIKQMHFAGQFLGWYLIWSRWIGSFHQQCLYLMCVCVQFAVKMTSLMRHDDQAVILGWKPLARAARAVKPGGLLAPTLEGKLRACCFFYAQNMQTWDPVLVGVQLYICLNIFELILILSKTRPSILFKHRYSDTSSHVPIVITFPSIFFKAIKYNISMKKIMFSF